MKKCSAILLFVLITKECFCAGLRNKRQADMKSVGDVDGRYGWIPHARPRWPMQNDNFNSNQRPSSPSQERYPFNVGSFPNQCRYPYGANVPNQGTFPLPRSFPNQRRFPFGGPYPNQGTYPLGGWEYPYQSHKYPVGGRFPNQGTFPLSGSFPNQGRLPLGGLYPVVGRCPFDNSNQGFYPTQKPTTRKPMQGSTTPADNSSTVRDCLQNCPVTSEYNPVCGTNNVTYANPGRLMCAQACGISVSLRRSSPCP